MPLDRRQYHLAHLRQHPFVRPTTRADARLNLAAGKPAAAVLALAPVEKEVRELRAGSGVLADALRAMGRAADATRYDLTALLATGHRDSRGNECAPDDVFGRPVTDGRMSVAFSVMRLSDGRCLLNDRGHYFIAPYPLNQLPLADLLASTNPKTQPRTKRGRSTALASLRERLDFALTWIRLRARETALSQRSMFGRPTRFGAMAAALISRAGRRFSRPVVSSVLRRIARRLFPAYKALPESVRALNHRLFLPRLLRWWSFFAAEIEMPDREDQLKLVDLRRAEGIAQILGHAEPYVRERCYLARVRPIVTAAGAGARRRILVTGAGGFIGRHLTTSFAAAGWNVVALVHRSCPASLHVQPRVRIEHADLAGNCPLPDGSFDAALHCAAAIPATTPNDTELVRINVEGTRRLLDHAVRHGASRIIYCSSMAVYGRINSDVVDVDTPIQDPDAYGRSKLVGEWALAELCERTPGIAGLSMRLTGVVGAGSHDNFLSDAMRRVLTGKEVVLRNPNSLFNNVVYVGDLVAFIAHLLESLPPGHRVTTIAADEPLPIRRVVALLFELTGRLEKVRFETNGRSFLISPEPARRLGFRVPTVAQSVTRFASDAVTDEKPPNFRN